MIVVEVIELYMLPIANSVGDNGWPPPIQRKHAVGRRHDPIWDD